MIYSQGFELDIPITDTGLTSLMLCALYGSSEMANTLLQFQPELNLQDPVGRTALHYAARAKNISVLSVLLEQEGIGKDIMTCGGMTPLMFAVESLSS